MNDSLKFREGLGPKNVGRMIQVSSRRLKSTTLSEPAVKLLPGEKSYLKAIISLESTFKAQGDVSLRPELRVEYERNLAVVDQAIAMTRFTAIRNPLDPDANSMLLSAYQSKVDLISSVVTEGNPAPLGDR